MEGSKARGLKTLLDAPRPESPQAASCSEERLFGNCIGIRSRLILLIGTAMVAGAAGLSLPAHPTSTNASSLAVPSTQSPQSPEVKAETFALKGTLPLAHPLFNSDSFLEQQRHEIIDYFLRQIAATSAKRDRLWQPNFSSIHDYEASLEEHRGNLRKMLGLIRPRLGIPQIKVLQQSQHLKVEDVTLPIDGDFRARALLFLPHAGGPESAVIALPPASETREEFAGVMQSMNPAEWLQSLLARDVAVIVPMTVERRADDPLCKLAGGKNRRRILWRAGFIVGRSLVGIEVQQVIALRRFLSSQSSINPKQIAVFGERQGGMTALYAGAIDRRLVAVGVVNYFQRREGAWEEPVDRVLYGQLNEFGDAEIAALIAPRPLLIVTTPGGPARPSVQAEAVRASRFYQGLGESNKLVVTEVAATSLKIAAIKLASLLGAHRIGNPSNITVRIPRSEVNAWRNEHFEALYHYLRHLDAESANVRRAYWHLDSTPAKDRLKKAADLRASLARLIGIISSEKIPLNPRTLLIGETDKFLAYDALLDVVPGVEAYGQLLVPRAVAGHMDQRLPAVICQHGFGGAPKYVTGVGSELESNEHFYHRFGERLAERGYVVFAPYLTVPEDPVSPGIVHRADLINPIVRLAACLGMMRTSIELAKLHRIVDFLESLPFVDAHRIGYYGLSYGGYSAMWMPPLEPRLRFTIISAYFNDWRLMLTDTTRYDESYWSLPDEDFYNWDVLNRFTHTELIAAMYPRPVCIEWGLNDPVTPPAWHRRAWKQVKRLAAAWDWDGVVDDDFIGPHTIHGIQTFFFIDRWLRPERSACRDYGCRDLTYCYETVAPDFHGYSLNSLRIVPYVTHFLDSDDNSVIRGKFYLSKESTMFTGMAFKLARVGNPGDLIVKFGSRAGAHDLGEARVPGNDVYPHFDLWYAALLNKPVRLNPLQVYFFEIEAESGRAPENCFEVFGPMPLGGQDYPEDFGLSFHVQTKGRDSLPSMPRD
jgi:dienelactone hydrolase